MRAAESPGEYAVHFSRCTFLVLNGNCSRRIVDSAEWPQPVFLLRSDADFGPARRGELMWVAETHE